VIDAEAVAWDKDEKRLLPFQELSRRKRKDVKAEDIKVKVHLFAFDLLYLNGKVCSSPSCPPDPLPLEHN
jgi:DNA ligase-1